MSTNDVPGAKPENRDVLMMGAWAEHADGSLALVQSVEAGRVVYSLFDVDVVPPVEYRDAMSEAGFKKTFSWDPTKPESATNIEWTWHDKTPFPWERVMDQFPAGQKHVSAVAQMTAAQRVAESLHLRAEQVDVRQAQQQRPTLQRAAGTILSGIREAISALRP